MMSCGLHMRLIGHPARIKGLRQFMDYVQGHPGVWLTKRSDVAKHWMEHFPYEPGGGGSDADVSIPGGLPCPQQLAQAVIACDAANQCMADPGCVMEHCEEQLTACQNDMPG